MIPYREIIKNYENFIISIIGDKGGLGKTTFAYLLLYRILQEDPTAILIDCDDEQYSSYEFSQKRKLAGLSPMPVLNIAPEKLEEELIRLSPKHKTIILEFGKANKQEDEDDLKRRKLAVKLADLVLSPIPVSPIDAEQIAKFESKMPKEILNLPAIMIPNRVKSLGQLEALKGAEPSFKYFKLSDGYMADRLIYQDCFGQDGRTIYEMKLKSESDKEGVREFEKLFRGIFYVKKTV